MRQPSCGWGRASARYAASSRTRPRTSKWITCLTARCATAWRCSSRTWRSAGRARLPARAAGPGGPDRLEPQQHAALLRRPHRDLVAVLKRLDGKLRQAGAVQEGARHAGEVPQLETPVLIADLAVLAPHDVACLAVEQYLSLLGVAPDGRDVPGVQREAHPLKLRRALDDDQVG